ncbi:MAG: flagellar type III secretion system pore protein FliP [Symbiobacteriaceae bacterium]|nr:flagellar type III secretion system pore protein FliP [Symbiobacteriaceae bacterium]
MDKRKLLLRAAVVSVGVALLVGVLASCTPVQGAIIPGLNIDITPAETPGEVAQSLQVLVLLTVLTLAPSILVLMTSFTRIVIVLGFTRNALGTQNMPPNQVVTGLALILTFFLMSPVFNTVYNQAWLPYSNGDLELTEALSQAEAPLKKFMLDFTRHEDVALFVNFAPQGLPEGGELPFRYVLPAFIISELQTAFQMGFMIYIPFLIIDMVVASTLMSMGMMMLPPVMISLPFKVLLFYFVNGWNLVVDAILRSFTVS